MPILDARRHSVPAGGEGLARVNHLNLSSSINDVIVVANATDRTQAVADLVAAGHQWPRPVYVDRADAPLGERTEVTYNGTTFVTVSIGVDSGWVAGVGVSGWGGNPEVRQVGRQVFGQGNWVRTGGDVSVPFNGPTLGSLPSAITPPTKELMLATANATDTRISIVVRPDRGIFLRAHYGSAPTILANHYFSFVFSYLT